MMDWSFTFLGTGTSQGIPVIGCSCAACMSVDPRDQRLRCSAWITGAGDGANILIDAGPDIRAQALRAKIHQLDAVLVTHEHYDHVGGLDDLRPFIFKMKAEMPIYAESRVLEDIKIRYQYAFQEQPYPGAPRFTTHQMQPGDVLWFGEVKVEVLRLSHGSLPILGFLVNDQLAYLTDTSEIPVETMERIQRVPVLVLDMLREQPHHSHNHLAQAVEQSVNMEAGKTFFIHMSHLLGPVGEWTADLPEDVCVAYDGLRLDFNQNGLCL